MIFQTYFDEKQKQIILSDEVKELFEENTKNLQNKTTSLKMPDYFINLN